MKFTEFIVDSYHLKKFLDNNTKDLFKDFSKHLNKATDAIEKHTAFSAEDMHRLNASFIALCKFYIKLEHLARTTAELFDDEWLTDQKPQN